MQTCVKKNNLQMWIFMQSENSSPIITISKNIFIAFQDTYIYLFIHLFISGREKTG